MSEIDVAWLDCTSEFVADWRNGGPAPSEHECGELLDKLIAEIRRLRAENEELKDSLRNSDTALARIVCEDQ